MVHEESSVFDIPYKYLYAIQMSNHYRILMAQTEQLKAPCQCRTIAIQLRSTIIQGAAQTIQIQTWICVRKF